MGQTRWMLSPSSTMRRRAMLLASRRTTQNRTKGQACGIYAPCNHVATSPDRPFRGVDLQTHSRYSSCRLCGGRGGPKPRIASNYWTNIVEHLINRLLPENDTRQASALLCISGSHGQLSSVLACPAKRPEKRNFVRLQHTKYPSRRKTA